MFGPLDASAFIKESSFRGRRGLIAAEPGICFSAQQEQIPGSAFGSPGMATLLGLASSPESRRSRNFLFTLPIPR
jgi:hypothetical protein